MSLGCGYPVMLMRSHRSRPEISVGRRSGAGRTRRRVQAAGGACASSRPARGGATPPFWGRRLAPARRSAED
eukprot:4525873-Prymnesium_polylepis.1